MGANELIRRKNQTGFETTRGTGVAATGKRYFQLTPNFGKALQEFSDQSGTYKDRRRAAYQRREVGFTAAELLTYEDFCWWLEHLAKGGVSPSADAGTPIAYTRPYLPSIETDDLKSSTLEFNHVGNVYKSTQLMANSATIRIDPDNNGGWMIDGDFKAIGFDPSTYTGSITDRQTEVIKAKGTKLFVDDATIGTTQVTGRMISASVTINNNLDFKAFAENETGPAPNKVGRGAQQVNGQFVLEFDSDAEFDKYRADDPVERFIRLEREGSIIHDAVKKRARLDLNGFWEAISWGNRANNIIATFGFSGYYNITSGYDFKAEVVNKLATLV